MRDFGFYFRLGWEHIINLNALDHILFIFTLAAVYVLHEWHRVLILITAFTIGHSVTLALSTLQIVTVPGKWVEFFIPCTIICTALANIGQKKVSANALPINYFLALFFGLIHGLGFANTLRFILAEDQSFGWALVGFNIGLEAGQVIIVLIILLLAQLFIGVGKVNRRYWVLIVSVMALAVALKMAVERLPVFSS